jgi:glycine dehydrogenase subunit 1
VREGLTDARQLAAMLDDDTAAVVVQSPNFYGLVEDQAALAAAAHAQGALYVACVNPLSLALLAPPGEVGADIATGDAQPFGVALQYGGPYVGFLAAREGLLRRMPGRIAGASVDRGGHRAYVLTLQTREQHIKRDRATSNICSNHALCATIATIYLAHQGKAGLRDVAALCVQKAHYAADRIAALPGYSLRFSGPFFHEFVVRCPTKATQINRVLLARGILGGIPLAEGPLAHAGGVDLENCMLICVTEVNSKEDIDALVAGLEAAA